MHGRTPAAILLVVAAATVLAGCPARPQPAQTVQVNDAVFDEMWAMLVETVRQKYGLASEQKESRLIESEWFPKEAESGATLLTERRMIQIIVVQQSPSSARRGDYVLGVQVRIQKRSGPGLFRKTPSQWRDAGRDVEMERQVAVELKAILG